jgi:hypothetical protein
MFLKEKSRAFLTDNLRISDKVAFGRGEVVKGAQAKYLLYD